MKTRRVNTVLGSRCWVLGAQNTSTQYQAPITILSLVLALSTASGCTREQWHASPGPDDAVAVVPWFSTMKKGLAIQPYAVAPREPVPGTVPITGAEPDLSVDREEDLSEINRIRNPAARTAESLERGKVVYDIYCLPCHGATGQSDGPIVEKFFPPPILTEPQARRLSDGYIYTLMRHGRGIMPPYGDKIHGVDRWHLVNYIRLMQGTRP